MGHVNAPRSMQDARRMAGLARIWMWWDSLYLNGEPAPGVRRRLAAGLGAAAEEWRKHAGSRADRGARAMAPTPAPQRAAPVRDVRRDGARALPLQGRPRHLAPDERYRHAALPGDL